MWALVMPPIGADRAGLVTGDEAHLGGQDRPGLLLGVGPALEQGGADAGALDGLGHVGEVDRRPGVQQGLLLGVQLGDEGVRLGDVDEGRLPGRHHLDDGPIGVVDGLEVVDRAGDVGEIHR
jgi:hypothetical protein